MIADFSNIVSEVNANITTNNTQLVTASKMRTVLNDFAQYTEDIFNDFWQETVDYVADWTVDNVVSTYTTRPLSANQGKILYDLVEDNSHNISDLTNTVNNHTTKLNNLVINNVTSTSTTQALSANQGRLLSERIGNNKANILDHEQRIAAIEEFLHI